MGLFVYLLPREPRLCDQLGVFMGQVVPSTALRRWRIEDYDWWENKHMIHVERKMWANVNRCLIE